MKRTMAPRKRKAGRGKKQNPEVDMEAMKVLRTLGDREAFYFYEAVGKPTGQSARDLSGFLENVKSVKPESLMFHLQRRDFQNWVEKSLGDSKLAKRLGMVASSKSEDARMDICRAVENRIKELKESSAEILVEESSVIVQC
jgi:hypothetical protein